MGNSWICNPSLADYISYVLVLVLQVEDKNRMVQTIFPRQAPGYLLEQYLLTHNETTFALAFIGLNVDSLFT